VEVEGRLRGEVLTFDEATGLGAIRGDDGARYLFASPEVRSPASLKAGQKVEFEPTEDRQARQVVLIAPPRPGPASALGHFDLGRVIKHTWAAIAGNGPVFFGAAVALVGGPSAILVLGQSMAFSGAPSAGTSLWLMGTGGTLQFIGMCLLQGMVIQAAANGFNGKSTTLGAAFGAGVSMVLPLVGLSIIVTLGITLGYMLLLVPGVILTVLWIVAAPAVVVEKRSIFASLQRSRDLTRGHRWPVFGLIVIYVLLAWMVSMFLGAFSLAAGGLVTGGSPNLWANLVAGPVANVLTGVVASAGLAALYHELRSAKEGVGHEALASVFD